MREGVLYFGASDPAHGHELWRTDGTRTGTRLLSTEATRARRFTAAGGRLFFATAEDDVYPGSTYWYLRPSGVWSTNGTAAGTVPAARQIVSFEPVGALGGAVLFGGADRVQRPFGGTEIEPWRAGVTGAVQVKDVNRFLFDTGYHHVCAYAGSDPGPGTVYNESTGTELWTSRGDAASTRLVADLRRGARGSYPQALTAAGNGRIVFAADDGETGQEPWSSDGTAAGTARLGDLNPGRDAKVKGVTVEDMNEAVATFDRALPTEPGFFQP